MLCVFNGDVMVLSPSWTTYKPQSQLAGHKAIVIHTKQEDEWRLTPSLVEQVVMENKLSPHRLLIMCNPDNPTGTSYQAHHLNQLSEVFRKHNIIVLSDEIYARLSFEGKHESIAKLGYHIYPDKLSEMRKAVASGASHTYSCAPAPVQHAALWLYKWTDEVQDYVLHERRILHAVALYTFRELTSVGVKVVMSTAGYYMFPNFEILRPALNARGITTGNQMCDAIMNEASVALMAGGPAFLRPVDDLTVRLCYINFDGGKAMQASRKRGTEGPLDDDFVVEHCRTLMEAIQALKKWVETQLDSERE
ncbi:aspartate aminotransferase-like isoform X2 [Ptychodera flava]|uniref:aspartate aminotransferase-like isoform X2 n=1 Tax=Ptychodera flava TaxID=63121 RepID=UPI003969F4F1